MCKSVDGYNIGAEQKCHRCSFLTFAWFNEIECEMGGIERETAVIFVLTHSMRDLTLLSTRAVHYQSRAVSVSVVSVFSDASQRIYVPQRVGKANWIGTHAHKL